MTSSRIEMIEAHLDVLRRQFRPNAPIKLQPIRRAFHEGRYADLVKAIRAHLNLRLPVRIGYVNSGGPEDAPAFVRMPDPMPPLGSPAFNATPVTIFLRKEFLKAGSPEIAAAAIAHEFSHVILNSTRHSLRNDEEAVDLTAMLLGFREAYAIAAIQWQDKRYGYLSRDEIQFARAQIIGGPAPIRWLRSNPERAIRAAWFVAIATLGLFGAISGGAAQGPHASEVSYCTTEQQQIDATRPLVDQFDPVSVASFNSRVRAFNSMCANR